MPKRSRREEREVRVRLLVFCLAMFIIVIGLVFVWRKLPYGVETKTEPVATAPVVEKEEPKPTPAYDPSEPVREKPAGMICGEANAICVSETVYKTLSKTVLTSPFSVTGTAIADLGSGGFYWRLEDADGTIAQSYTRTTSQDIGVVGNFTLRDFLFTVPRSSTGTLILFEKERENGDESPVIENSVIHDLRIPVRLSREKTTIVLDSKNVFIAKTRLPIEATIRFILKDEKRVELESVTLTNGVLNAHLFINEAWPGLDVLVDKIKQAMTQFSAVKSFVYTFDEMR